MIMSGEMERWWLWVLFCLASLLIAYLLRHQFKALIGSRGLTTGPFHERKDFIKQKGVIIACNTLGVLLLGLGAGGFGGNFGLITSGGIMTLGLVLVGVAMFNLENQ
jgi:hypothetical protein